MRHIGRNHRDRGSPSTSLPALTCRPDYVRSRFLVRVLVIVLSANPPSFCLQTSNRQHTNNSLCCVQFGYGQTQVAHSRSLPPCEWLCLCACVCVCFVWEPNGDLRLVCSHDWEWAGTGLCYLRVPKHTY